MVEGKIVTNVNGFDFVKDSWGVKTRSEIPISPQLYRNLAYHHKSSQKDLFTQDSSASGFCDHEARILEIIAQGKYGGTLRSQRKLYGGSGNGNSLNCYPDLVDFYKNWAREIKGVVLRNYLKLNDEQIAKYVMLFIGEYFKKRPEIHFNVYRHGVEGIKKRFHGRDLDELVAEISKNIVFSLSLPFSLVYHIHALGKDSEFTSRSERDTWQDYYTSFSTRGLDSMIREPEKTLRILGVDLSRYGIQKTRSATGVTLNKKGVISHPEIVVIDRMPNLLIERINQEGLAKHFEALERFSERNREGSVDISSLKIPQEYIDRYFDEISNLPF